MPHFHDRLLTLQQSGLSLLPFQYGLEKESLRVAPDGMLAQTPHPQALGSALTHPNITTDYSEALLELVTPVFQSHSQLLASLTQLHQFSQQNLANEERLWAVSMPCRLPEPEQIPLAQYGQSNVGRMKTLYRKGLGYRYGRPMQTIAGVHYNWSLTPEFWQGLHRLEPSQLSLRDFVDQQYLDTIRNFRRLVWLIPYLFGASPALCRCFVPQGHVELQAWDDYSWFAPYATSLRMSELGYQNKRDLGVSFNDLPGYLQRLEWAIRTPHAEFAAMGVEVEGEYRQLNANLLQIENEYYSSIRPKQPPQTGERPSKALRQRGIEYLEVRALDLNPFSAIGVDPASLKFIDLLLVYCLLSPSPLSTVADEVELQANLNRVVWQGRKPGLVLQQHESPRALQDWALAILAELQPLAQWLDSLTQGDPGYQQSLDWQRQKVLQPELTPSARMLQEMQQSRLSFYDWAQVLSRSHHRQLQSKLPLEIEQRLSQQAQQSLWQQQQLEASPQLPFAQYLAAYFD